jgi:hypothetical protein
MTGNSCLKSDSRGLGVVGIRDKTLGSETSTNSGDPTLAEERCSTALFGLIMAEKMREETTTSRETKFDILMVWCWHLAYLNDELCTFAWSSEDFDDTSFEGPVELPLIVPSPYLEASSSHRSFGAPGHGTPTRARGLILGRHSVRARAL